MAVRKVLFVREDDGIEFIGDSIEYERKRWLVPEWLVGPTEGTLCPARIICLAGLPVGSPGIGYQNVDLVLSTPLSRDILEGRKVSQSPLVIERPDIHLREDHDFHR
jgi:hypothetical protein